MRKMDVVKGVMVGVLVGSAVYLMTADCMKSTRKTMKRGANRALRQARNVIDEVSYMIR